MKILFRNPSHFSAKSHDCLIGEIGSKKVKFTYEAYNAVEKCTIEIFDGYKWNFCLCMNDMGIHQESSAYNIWDENKRKLRADETFKTAEKMLDKIIYNLIQTYIV